MPKILLTLLLTAFSHPSISSELSRYQNEWCASNQLAQAQLQAVAPAQVCYGTTSFLAQTTRAIVFIYQDGRRELYVEGDFQSVDLMNLQFSIVGPVNISKGLVKGVGQVRLLVDQNGEVMAVQGQIRQTIPFEAYRP